MCIGMFTFFTIQPTIVNAQFCDSLTPTFNVDLSASPFMSWVSPVIARNGSCCGSTAPDKCLEFVITLNPNSAAVVFNFASGAVPPGALFYQIDCGPATPVGSPICLTGTGPFHLTFCKPGNNSNTFSIETIPDPIFGPNLALGDGCSDDLWVHFYDETTITWNSINPGAPGSQNSLLSGTSGCDTVAVTNNPLAPPTVDYLVCGMAANGCSTTPICDTLSVQFTPPVSVSIDAPDTTLCPNETSVPVQALVSGGTPPYSYSWSNGAMTQATSLGAGTHTVSITDATNCVIRQATVTITQILPPAVNASGAVDVCANYVGSIAFSATAANTQGVLWTGGSGTFSPSNTALNVDYTPGPGETAIGTVPITVVTVNTTGCPEVMAATSVTFNPILDAVAIQTVDVSCFGMTNGMAQVTVTGVNNPYNFAFDGGAYSTTNNITALAPGNHTVSILNSLGCDTLITFVINEPPLLTLNELNHTDVLCNGDATGSAAVQAAGGYGAYAFNWNSTPVQSSSFATNLTAGSYTATVTDANGCVATTPIVITEPAPLTNAFVLTSPLCYGFSNGSIAANANGGVSPYAYAWSNGATMATINAIPAGAYTMQLTDANGCILNDNTFLTEPTQLTMSISNDTIICPGTPISLQVSANGGTQPYSYLWNPGAGTSNPLLVSPNVPTNYTCEVKDANGCLVMSAVQVNTFSLNSNDIVASINDSIICAGSSAQLNGAYIGTDPTVNLEWTFCPACPIAQTVNPSATTSYTLVATNQCNQQITDQVTLTIINPPVVNLNVDLGAYCQGEYFSVHNDGDNNPAWSYTWTFADGFVSHDMTAIHSFANAGTYPVSLVIVDSYGCQSAAASAGFVTINPQAHADFTANTLETTNLNPVFHFINNSTNATTYEWFFDDGQASYVTNPTHTYQTYGTFTVTLNANNQYNCPDQATLVVEVKPTFNVYVPNTFTPDGDLVNNTFLAQGYGIQETDFTMLIFNRWGEILFESHDMTVGWDGSYQAGADQVKDGTYTWVINFKDLTNQKHQITGHVNLLR